MQYNTVYQEIDIKIWLSGLHEHYCLANVLYLGAHEQGHHRTLDYHIPK